jgi:capsular polysaccharide transport system permease protein
MREVLTRYGRHNIGFFWLFLEPMLFTLGITTLWTLTKATHGSDLPIVGFAVTGYSSILLWRNASNRCLKALEPNLDLFYHSNITILDIFLSRIFLEIIGATVSLLLLTFGFTIIGWMDCPVDILKAIEGWILLVAFAISLGILVGALSERGELLDRLWHIITYLTFPMSGAGFLVEWLPKSFQKAVLLLPMVHGVEIVRSGYFGDKIKAHYDLKYACAFTLSIFCLGLFTTHSQRKSEI